MTPLFLATSFDPLSFDPAAILLTWLTFLALLLILGKFVWKPTMAAIETRETRIEESIQHAEDARKHADELLESYEAKLASAERDALAVREQARADAEALASDLKARAEADARQRVERAAQEIELARTQAVEDLRNEAVVLGMAVASKLVGRSLDGDDQQRLAAEVVAGLSGVSEG